MEPTSKSILALQGVNYAYGVIQALRQINLKFYPGSLTAVIGPNGGGKSTLLKLIAGVLSLKEGQLERDVPMQNIAYLPQAKEIDRTFPIRVEDVVAMGLWSQSGSFRRLSPRDRETIHNALICVNLQGFENRSIEALSGGQLQRLFFARVIAQDANIILLDEPFTGIDAKTTTDLLGLIHQWHNQGKTVIAVIHDLEQARQHFNDVVLVAKELIGHGPAATVLQAEYLAKATFYV